LPVQEAKEITECPDCGQQIRVDRRYVTWCDNCDWNLDPTHVPNQTPAWRLRLEHRLAESLYGELVQGNVHRPGWDAARIAAHLLSALILLLPLAALRTRPSAMARVVLGTNESRTIDQELAPTAARLLRALRAEL
jgi:hypothetical protein